MHVKARCQVQAILIGALGRCEELESHGECCQALAIVAMEWIGQTSAKNCMTWGSHLLP